MFKDFAIDVGLNAGAMALVEFTGLNNMVQNATKMPNLTNATTFAVANDMVKYYRTGHSKILNRDLISFGDDVVYNTFLYEGLTRAQVGNKLQNTLQGVIPLSPDLLARGVTSSLVVGGNVLKDTINSNPSYANGPAKYITNFVSSVYGSTPTGGSRAYSVFY